MTITTVGAEVRDRPILFSGEMVRAILDGRKTQTRRVLRPLYNDPAWEVRRGADGAFRWALGNAAEATPGVIRCPYGVPGDRLWVRETWTAELEWPAEYRDSRLHWWHEVPAAFRGEKNAQRVYYAADRSEYETMHDHDGTVYDLAPAPEQPSADDLASARWKPSIHMPRWASRITLELTDVRVERVQEITDDDAEAEGCPGFFRRDGGAQPGEPRGWYRSLWDELNAKRGYDWNVNSWVWVLTFRRLG